MHTAVPTAVPTVAVGSSDRMARYTLHEVLGRGKFGVVHRGSLNSTGEEVAIKLLVKKRSNAKQLDSALREAELMKQVFWHPHIVNLREFFETAEHDVLVMDMASGGELFNRIVEKGCYTESDASEVMRNVMSAVAHCHHRGVAHRDLKPENIMLASTENGTDVLLCDFGLAAQQEGETPLQGKAGTMGYCAPEMLTGEAPSYSMRVDEYAVGVILYILLGGYHPFDPDCTADDETVIRRVRGGKFDFGDASWGSISESAKGLVRKLLATDPKERISADEALAHPWLRGDAASNRPLPQSAKRLAAFNSARQAWRNATKAAINREGLSDAERRTALAAAFRLIDADNNGQITREELTVFLDRLEARATPQEIQTMLAHADVDGNGMISLEEFVAMNL